MLKYTTTVKKQLTSKVYHTILNQQESKVHQVKRILQLHKYGAFLLIINFLVYFVHLHPAYVISIHQQWKFGHSRSIGYFFTNAEKYIKLGIVLPNTEDILKDSHQGLSYKIQFILTMYIYFQQTKQNLQFAKRNFWYYVLSKKDSFLRFF